MVTVGMPYTTTETTDPCAYNTQMSKNDNEYYRSIQTALIRLS